MVHHVALVRTDVSKELSASFISVVPSPLILVTLMKEALFLQNVGSYKSHMV
jgi:hypothetical protein